MNHMDCLIQRLNEITARLIAEEKVLEGDDGTVLACHGKLDALEALVWGTVVRADDDSGLRSTPTSSGSGQTSTGHGETLSAQEQQELSRRISNAARELRNRREELKHVHDLAIIQAEHAAQRILSLESEVRELESDLEASQSSHSFLKLQLKVLEVQALRYIPADDEEGLVEGFQRWKKDWADLDGRLKTRQKRALG
ncbi:hypothetical protein GP486_008848 [Trichoglossum hirsutum]|uniref:Uncharacterized protein n=1 Tax=Trichoglossum hirsutum TaxID=265104 RepID=A0A9P8KXR5_9PEZI|nr:hypothetical protein GP486_008848 [Trichoglossum hirsutum]